MEASVPRTERAMSRRSIAAAAVLSTLLLTACGGTGDGGTGDPPSKPTADLYGNCARLADLQGEAPWFEPGNTDSAGCSYPVDRHVCVSGVTIIAIDRFDETGDGATGNYYVQDSSVKPIPSSGITVFDPSFSPPDLRLAVGDVADVLGSLMEFAGPSTGRFEECRTLPEIGGAMTLRFENGPVTPIPIKIADLVTYPSARRLIGMLVKLEGVTVQGEPNLSSGRYTVPLKVDGFNGTLEADDVPRLSNELFDLSTQGLADGSKLSSVIGVVTYFYGFKIAPRSAEDLVP